MKRRIGLVIAFLVLSLPVFAGHYRLDSVKFPFPMPVKQLKKLKINTTLDLWKATRTHTQRKKLTEKLGLPMDRVVRFHDFCDLLRVRGIGTKMAWVMQAAGIKNAAALAKADPDALNRRIKQANKRVHVLGKLPGVELVRWWIRYAASLK